MARRGGEGWMDGLMEREDSVVWKRLVARCLVYPVLSCLSTYLGVVNEGMGMCEWNSERDMLDLDLGWEWEWTNTLIFRVWEILKN